MQLNGSDPTSTVNCMCLHLATQAGADSPFQETDEMRSCRTVQECVLKQANPCRCSYCVNTFAQHICFCKFSMQGARLSRPGHEENQATAKQTPGLCHRYPSEVLIPSRSGKRNASDRTLREGIPAILVDWSRTPIQGEFATITATVLKPRRVVVMVVVPVVPTVVVVVVVVAGV